MTTWAEDQSELAIRHRAEVGALNEEIDRLLAALRVEQDKTRKIAELEERIRNLTVALDEALGLQRAKATEKEALEL